MFSFFKKYKVAFIALIVALAFASFRQMRLFPISVNQGGTGVNTITGIIQGNGTIAIFSDYGWNWS